MPVNAPKIKDIDKKIEIWSNPPYISKKNKLDYMKINFDANRFDSTVKYAKKIASDKYEDIEELADTFTYLYEIKPGYEKETYYDKPYIIPYLVNSDKAIILLSGGGFSYKTFHGGVNGGKKVAEILNERGYSVFLLDYRINPYSFPAAMLDLQRAIRYIRFNKEKFGVKKLSLLGYSAGGYVVASFINKYMGQDFYGKDYLKDEIDNTSDNIKSAAFVYPCLTFNYNVPMLFSVANSKDVKDDDKRKDLLDELDLPKFINSKEVVQFITYSNADKTVDYRGTESYIKALKSQGGNITRIFVPDEDHGFDESKFIYEYINWLSN